jgi:uncharacterized protein YbcI
MRAMKTRGQLEAEISEAVVGFENEFMGRGSLEAQSHMIDDMVLVRLGSVLSPMEIRIVKTKEPRKGSDLVKQMRMELLALSQSMLERSVQKLTGCPVKSLHTDVTFIRRSGSPSPRL